MLDNVLCEVEHTVEIKKHDKTIASTVVNTNKHNRSGTIVIKYGNFLDDNIVNGKDFALALHSGYTDTELIDLGYISGEKFDIKNGYDVQVVPNVMNSDNEPKADSDYSRTFTSQVYLGREYTVTECGLSTAKIWTVICSLSKMSAKQTPAAMLLNAIRKVCRAFTTHALRHILTTARPLKQAQCQQSFISNTQTASKHMFHTATPQAIHIDLRRKSG